MKKALTMLVLTALVLSVCLGSGWALAEEHKPYLIGYSNYSLGNPYRVQFVTALEMKAEQYREEGILEDLIVTNSDSDINKQISDLRDLIARGCDAILISAQSPTAFNAVLQEAMDMGVVVVSFNSHPDMDLDCKVVENDFNFGATGGQWLTEKLGGKGKIVVLNGIAGNDVSDLRWNGANSFISQSDIEVVGTADCMWDYATAKSAMEDLLAANPQIDGVYSQGGAMTWAAIDAFNEAGRALVPMTGENSNGFFRVWMENREKGFDSIAPITSDGNGIIALDFAIAKLNGEDVPAVYDVPTTFVDGASLESYYRADLPDSFVGPSVLADEVILRLQSVGN